MLGTFTSFVENLESRRLLSMTTVKGTQADDLMHIGGGPGALDYFVELNGMLIAKGTFSANDPDKVIIADLMDGNDRLTVDNGYGGKLLAFGGPGNDTLIGGNGVRGESLLGNVGNDSLIGNGGPDKLVGGAGNDFLQGGSGADQLWGDRAAGLDDTGHIGRDTLLGDAGTDMLDGGGGNDLMEGGDDADTLVDGAGDDLMYGQGGNDLFYFDRETGKFAGGNDLLDGGAGKDTINVYSTAAASITLDGKANDGPAGDRADVQPNIETFLLYQFPSKSLMDASGAQSAVNIVYFGIQATDDNIKDPAPPASTLVGSAFDDLISIGGFSNIIPQEIHGGLGNDSIDGSFASDTIYGEDGNDTLNGKEGNDYVDGGAGNDSVYGDVGNDTMYGGTGNDSMQGAGGRDTLNGGPGSDTLLGGNGRDTLNGGTGNDFLYGGPSDADRILGGAGSDSAAKDSKDTYDSVETLLA